MLSQVDEAVGEALAKEVEKMVQELHDEEEELCREPPEGQEVRDPLPLFPSEGDVPLGRLFLLALGVIRTRRNDAEVFGGMPSVVRCTR